MIDVDLRSVLFQSIDNACRFDDAVLIMIDLVEAVFELLLIFHFNLVTPQLSSNCPEVLCYITLSMVLGNAIQTLLCGNRS